MVACGLSSYSNIYIHTYIHTYVNVCWEYVFTHRYPKAMCHLYQLFKFWNCLVCLLYHGINGKEG